MSNLMTMFNTGVSGLKTNQAAINTTAHNIANVDTEGYVRQQVLMADANYNTINRTANAIQQIGLGTNMAVIRQVRSVLLDKAYRLETGRQAFYEAQTDVVYEMENLLGETEGEQFQNAIGDLWKTLEELAKEPDSIVKRQALISQANTFVRRATDISDQLKKYQTSLNTEIVEKVDRINQIGKAIEELNYKICAKESGVEQANDYRDARNKLLDELAGLAYITYKENDAGVVTVNLENRQFVLEDHVETLSTQPIDEMTDMLTVVWKDGDEVFDIESGYSSSLNTDIGALKGLLIARGGKPANYTDIPDKNDAKYYTIDGNGNQVFLEEQYATDVQEYNKKVDSSLVMAMQAQFDQLVHGIITAINDALSPNTDLESLMNDMGVSSYDSTAAINYTITEITNGMTYTEKVSITSGGKTSTITKTDKNGNVTTETKTDPSVTLDTLHVWDEYNSGIGMDEDSTAREVLFDRKYTERYQEATITCSNGDTKTIWIYNEEDPEDIYSLYTLGQVELNTEVLENPSKIPLSGNSYKGLSVAYDMTILENLLATWDEPFGYLNPNTLTPSNFNDYYIALVGDLANRGKVFDSIVENQKSTTNDVDEQRQRITGVSSDEELTNLIKFQYGYNANSRFITVVDEMLETIITQLG